MNFLRLPLSPLCVIALAACTTYGDPDQSRGYFDWAPSKSNREVFQPRRAALGYEQSVGASLRSEQERLKRKLAQLNARYGQRKQAGASSSELAEIQREINSLKKQLNVLTAQ